jgi:hypothetical protein
MKACGTEICVSVNSDIKKCPLSEVKFEATCPSGFEKIALKKAHSSKVNLCVKRETNNRPVISI